MDSIERQLAARGLRLDQQCVDAIHRLQERGRLTLGWPNRDCVLDSLVWRPAFDDHNLRTTAIVSSRLSRQVDRLDPIFRVLRCAISQLDPSRQQVVAAVGTTTHRYVTRACELFGVPLLQVIPAKPKQPLNRWLQSCRDLHAAGEVSDSMTTRANECVFVSNPIGTGAKHPIRDQIENLASDQLLVLHARADGNLSQLLRQRLDVTPNEAQKSRTYLALGDKLVPQDVANGLMSQGAIGWLPIPNSDVQACPMDWTPAARSPIWNSLPNADRFFIHCTRRAAGPWPDQADTEFLDELILGHPARDRSSLSALSRIVRMQTLLAAHDSIRDATAVVSFTEAPIEELVDMRTFRAHRGRWDFEPYGIAIDREWLIRQGARKVIYGDEQKWHELSESDRPLYQKIGDQPNAIDWTIEREWRVVGDVDFSSIPGNKAAVFVPTHEEANQLARISAWPIVVLPS